MPEFPDPLSSDSLQECQEILQYQFKCEELLVRCLTHASASRTRLESNERLEFLGDAILGAIVCQMLFERYPESSEGELTRIKSVVVSRQTCARLVARMDLDQYMVLGKGIATHNSVPSSVLATTFEAILGGIYIDGGFPAASEFIKRVICEEVDRAADSAVGVNYKSLFQQKTQRVFGETPAYQVLDEKGPDHSKCFKVAAQIGIREFPAAWGSSKKIAEQRAAHNALAELDGEEIPYLGD